MVNDKRMYFSFIFFDIKECFSFQVFFKIIFEVEGFFLYFILIYTLLFSLFKISK